MKVALSALREERSNQNQALEHARQRAAWAYRQMEEAEAQASECEDRIHEIDLALRAVESMDQKIREHRTCKGSAHSPADSSTNTPRRPDNTAAA